LIFNGRLDSIYVRHQLVWDIPGPIVNVPEKPDQLPFQNGWFTPLPKLRLLVPLKVTLPSNRPNYERMQRFKFQRPDVAGK
jgi:hypothetical protein